jgi:L-iditol 2-dehydrogenase
MQKLPGPVTGAGELLVRMYACGICGSDLHAFHGGDARRVPPILPGREAARSMAAVARAGQRVAVNPLVTCGGCAECRGGREHLFSSLGSSPLALGLAPSRGWSRAR